MGKKRYLLLSSSYQSLGYYYSYYRANTFSKKIFIVLVYISYNKNNNKDQGSY